MNWGLFYEKKIKKSQCRKKWKGDPWGIIFSEKNVPQWGKTQRWDPLVSPGIVCYGKNLCDSVRWAKWFNLTPLNLVEIVELFWPLRVYRKKIFKNTDEKPLL